MTGLLALLGCYNTPIDTAADSPAPLRMPSPRQEAEAHDNYEKSLTGGQIFTMYCGYCHFPRSLAERPFANYRTAVAHMRVVADLTGEEQAKLLAWMRRWHDVPPPSPPVEAPSPKRIIFSQPINELQPQPPATLEEAPKPAPLPPEPAPKP
jgi:hypothetical protein